MLKLSEEYLSKNRANITCMEAIVKKNNLASQKTFLKSGYRINEKSSQEYIYFYKHLSKNHL